MYSCFIANTLIIQAFGIMLDVSFHTFVLHFGHKSFILRKFKYLCKLGHRARAKIKYFTFQLEFFYLLRKRNIFSSSFFPSGTNNVANSNPFILRREEMRPERNTGTNNRMGF